MTPERPSDPEPLQLELASGPVMISDHGPDGGRAGTLPILAVHGLPGSHRDYRWLGAALEPTTRFIRVDLPGFGGTPLETAASPTIPGRAAILPQILDALSIDRACILGHSMGGPVALAAAVRSPDRFPALALLASVGLRRHRLLRRSPGSGLWAAGMKHPLLARPMLGAFRRGLKAMGFPGSYTDLGLIHLASCVAAVSFEAIATLATETTTPTYLAWANDDPFIESEIFEEMAAALPEGPRETWTTGGHNIQKSRALEIRDSLLPWISSLTV